MIQLLEPNYDHICNQFMRNMKLVEIRKVKRFMEIEDIKSKRWKTNDMFDPNHDYVGNVVTYDTQLSEVVVNTGHRNKVIIIIQVKENDNHDIRH